VSTEDQREQTVTHEAAHLCVGIVARLPVAIASLRATAAFNGVCGYRGGHRLVRIYGVTGQAFRSAVAKRTFTSWPTFGPPKLRLRTSGTTTVWPNGTEIGATPEANCPRQLAFEAVTGLARAALAAATRMIGANRLRSMNVLLFPT
jgi:hypothetical protein